MSSGDLDDRLLALYARALEDTDPRVEWEPVTTTEDPPVDRTGMEAPDVQGRPPTRDVRAPRRAA